MLITTSERREKRLEERIEEDQIKRTRSGGRAVNRERRREVQKLEHLPSLRRVSFSLSEIVYFLIKLKVIVLISV
jgi:hypothetical protein